MKPRTAHLSRLLTLALVASPLACKGIWHTRWANRLDTYATTTSAEAGTTLASLEAANVKMTPIAEGEYISVRLEKICFTDLPGALGNVPDAWVGVTVMSKTTSDTSLLSELEEFQASGAALEDSDLAKAAYMMPTQKVVTNEGACIKGDFGTAWMPVENYDVSKPPRFLAMVDLLQSKKYADQLRQVDQFQKQANEIAKAVAGNGLDEYSTKFSDIVSKTSDLLRVVVPDRHILWLEQTVPIVREAGVLSAPSTDQYFVSLFADPTLVRLEGKKGALSACKISQSMVEASALAGELQLRSNNTVTPLKACPGGEHFQAPYVVWRVRRSSYGKLGESYWRPIVDILTAAETKDTEFTYTTAMSEAKQRVEEVRKEQRTGVRLLSDRQYNEFRRFDTALSELLFNLGLGQHAIPDCAKAVDASRTLQQLRVSDTLGASDAVTGIIGRIKKRLDDECGETAVRAVQRDLAQLRADYAASSTSLGDTVHAFRRDVLCDLFLPFGAVMLDASLAEPDRCPTARADGGCARQTTTQDLDPWIKARRSAYSNVIYKRASAFLSSAQMMDRLLDYAKQRQWVDVSLAAPSVTAVKPPPAFGKRIVDWIRNPADVMAIAEWAVSLSLVDWPRFVSETSPRPADAAQVMPLHACAQQDRLLERLDDAKRAYPELRSDVEVVAKDVTQICRNGSGPLADYDQARATLLRQVLASGAKTGAGEIRCESREIALRRDSAGDFHYDVVSRQDPNSDDLVRLNGPTPTWMTQYTSAENTAFAVTAKGAVAAYFGVALDDFDQHLTALDARVATSIAAP